MFAPSRPARLAAVSAFALLVGCNDKALQVAGSADGGRPVGSSISAEQASKVLAKIGDRTITVGDYVAALKHMDQFDRLRYQSPDRRKELLREMVNVQLLADEALAKGYDKDPLAQQELRSILRTAMMEQAHATAQATPNSIPAADVQAYYEGHKDQYRDTERRRISLITVADEKSGNAVLEAARGTTNAKWGELVQSKSLDPGAKANVPVDLAGDYGIVAPVGDPTAENTKAPDEVRAAAFQIPKVGDVYEKLVKPSHEPRFYIVRLTQKTDAHERTLAEADRAIRVKLVQDKVREREEDLLNRLRAEYPVQIDDAVLATVHVDLAPPRNPHGAAPDAGPPQ